jgi:hypothetical protein
VLAGLWLARLQIGDLVIRNTLAQAGVVADFRLIQLNFSRARLAQIVVGDADQPDFAAAFADVNWSWNGLSPRLEGVRLIAPRLHLSVNESGEVSAGELTEIEPGEPSGRRPGVPRIRLTIEEGQIQIDTPAGPLVADLSAQGVIGRDFAAIARVTETTHAGTAYALDAVSAELTARSDGDALALRFTARARGALWNGTRIGATQIDASATSPLDLATLAGNASLRVASAIGDNNELRGVAASVRGAITFSDISLSLDDWNSEARVTLARGEQREMWLENGVLNARYTGENGDGQMIWSMDAARAQGLGVFATSPAASGHLDIARAGTFNGTAQLALANASLTGEAQQNLRDAIPAMNGAPIGPTLAQAEAAFDRAADRFSVTIPLTIAYNEGITRIVAAQPIEMRAASGARIGLAPLRPDTTMLAMQWPGSTLSGAAAIELAGGGVPNATLLFDTIVWSPAGGFDADGTLAIRDWRAEGASIAANEVIVSIATPPGERGQLELVGPVTINGPLGDGAVRDMRVDLDLAVQWGQGWRVAPNDGCMPVQLGGLDAAGLSFQGGAFRLCAGAGGAIVSADANGRWGDGFTINGLSLNGRMAGEAAQPARLSSQRIVGRFSGTGEATQLSIEATAPSLSVDMEENRTIDIVGQSLTALARFGGGSWRVDGAFDVGQLNDPGLPGAVAAIRGNWSAVPEDDGVLIQVAAGEAALTAHAASAEDERPLFNPMRLANVTAEMRGGVINAQGVLLLDSQARNLASFTARHEIESGVGVAAFNADRLEFGDALQPYEITELARGVVENVHGPASGAAEVTWDKEAVRASGRARLEGLSLAMATIPVIENVRGEVVFDDLFALTTPPGQQVTVGLVNPGIAVENGRLRFQLLGEQRVAIESAEFDFASGILALDPTTITLGADEANVRLLLRDVDAARLLATLAIPDLEASGTIEGSFPLRLARNTAFVTNGELYAAPGGGTIRYIGNAGDGATGAARVAFDALKNFDYDNLRITLNGDISGEVVSAISFTGENSGRPVDLTELAPIPGIGRVTATGVPFAFNVTITAPFRRLAQTAAGFANPRDIISDVMVTQTPPDATPAPSSNPTPDQ